jgi:hypothetical protein
MKGNSAEWRVTIPANATGRLELSADAAADYKLEGVPLAESKLAKPVRHGYELQSGSYTFSVILKQ